MEINPDGYRTFINTGLVANYGTCDSGMGASTTTIVSADLASYGADYFNNKYYMQIIKNANSVGNAPEREIRQITDYVDATGTFTVTAFSANVEATDEIIILHESLISATADGTISTLLTHVVGHKSDAAVTTVGTTASLMAYLKGALNEIAGISFLSNSEKARLDLGFHEQLPLKETLAGYLDQDANIAVNNTATETNVTQQCARYPGAVSWLRRQVNGTNNVNIISTGKYLKVLTSAAGASAIGAIYPILIRPTSFANWLPNDERFIFEALVQWDANNQLDNAAQTFFGIISTGVEADWSGLTINPGKGIWIRSYGAGGREIIGCCSDGVEAFATRTDITNYNTIKHYKFIYEVGTGTEFFVDGVSVGTVTTNLPLSGSTPIVFIPLFWNNNVSANPEMRIYGMRCYFQNGA